MNSDQACTKQHQQQPAPQHRLRDRLPGGDRGELAGEAGGELGLLEDVDQVDGAPAAFDLRLQRDEVLRLLLLAQRRDLDPRLAVLLDDVHPARGAQLQRRVEAGQGLAQPFLQGLDELLRVLRLADRVVVHIAVVLEVRWQVVLRVLPPVRARHPDLPPPQRVPQGHEHAQLVRDALDPTALIHHSLAPLLAHHPGQRDLLRLVEERPLLRDGLVQVPLEQVDRVHHRPVGGVVALQLQRVEQG
ncbi:hypothetical protein [Streptomyces sp. NPDC088554]|uniref:hypothetical protein n=1 Tax=Streptomyces sp. NPDC088554 TaxID=3365865 RepID=UPI003802FC65